MHVLMREGGSTVTTSSVTPRLRWSRKTGAGVRSAKSRIDLCIIAAEVEDFARDTGRIRPAVIRVNYGMQRARGGGNAVRAVACLPALAGHWRDAAGGVLLSTSGMYSSTPQHCIGPIC